MAAITSYPRRRVIGTRSSIGPNFAQQAATHLHRWRMARQERIALRRDVYVYHGKPAELMTGGRATGRIDGYID